MSEFFDWLDWFLVAYETQVVAAIALGLAAYCLRLSHKLTQAQDAVDKATGAVNVLLREKNAVNMAIRHSDVIHVGEIVDEHGTLIAEYNYN